VARLDLQAVLGWTGGSLLKAPHGSSVSFAGLSSDSRAVCPGSLFLALRGQNHDGHLFLAQAVAAGATGLVIADPAALDSLTGTADPAVILVGDTLAALQAIAAGYRQTLPARVVGISGSVGKTSTRQMISACLQPRLSVHQTSGNLNNEIGLPQTLLLAGPEHQAVILEMGMRGPGEISLLSRIARPDVAVLTNIGFSHIGRLGSQAAILAAKAEILDGLMPGGLLVLNGDDPLLLGWGTAQAERCRLAWATADASRAVDCSKNGATAFLAADVQTSPDGCAFTASLFENGRSIQSVPVHLPFPGDHHVRNALLGLAVAHELGVPLAEAANGAATCQTTGNRQRIIEAGGLLIMDDSYNASPESMLAALRTLSGLARGRRLAAALGGMLELGEFADQAHYDLGGQAARFGFDRLFVTGPQAAAVAAGAHEAVPGLPVDIFPDNLSLAGALTAWLKPGDALLVKGSRGFAMEKVTEAVLENLTETEKPHAH
jgi:UDP-N-acetylmuramoyl-tripeptide--D-alanyl-D-alanine ligase